MKPTAADWRVRGHWVLAAVVDTIGWPGIVGVLLLLGAAAEFAQDWARERAVPGVVAAAVPRRGGHVEPGGAASAPAVPATLVLAEAPAVQRELSVRAARLGLAWPTGDYRLVPPSDDRPPSFEIHCTLKGQYPSIRHFIAETLTTPPAPALREYSLSRQSSNTLDVEAHLVFAYFMPSLTDGGTAAPAAQSPAVSQNVANASAWPASAGGTP